MTRAYKYVFYKLYLFERMVFEPVPGLTAFGLMLVCQFFNIVALYFTLKCYFGFSLPFAWSASNFAVGAALLIAPQYFLLLHGDRFRQVAREFAHESERQSIIGGIIVGVYVVFSFVFFLWSAFLPRPNV